MARKLRIEFEGAMYHVMCRGNQGQAVFLDDMDRECFIYTLGEVCERSGWVVYAYVLMGNHYHILFQTPEGNLVAGMKWFQGAYTQRFNVRHRRFGHLFQGRYKALLVEDGMNYFGTVVDYIHLNPARARSFDLKKEKLENFLWSSYPLVFRASKRPGWLDLEGALMRCGYEDDRKGREQYRRGIQRRIAELLSSEEPWKLDENWEELRRGWSWGSDAFEEMLSEKMAELMKGKNRKSYTGKAIKKHDEREAERLLKEGLKQLGIQAASLAGMKKNELEKVALCVYIRRRTLVENRWLARQLYCGDPSNISRFMKRAREGKEKGLNRLIKKLSKLK